MESQSKTLVLHPLIGQVIHQYRVDTVLGQGGMGVVYRAHDTKLQRPVALKLLPGEWTADEERRKRFMREARAAARVIHPSIAQVYDVDEHEGATFIAMEWVEGRTVRDLVQTRALDLLGAMDIGIQVAEGLAKAHRMGIVHRDIKSANVMVTPEGHAKILDFGLAKLLTPSGDSGTTTGPTTTEASLVTQPHSGQVLGTAAYMSPEQVKGLPVDARSDLFSCGVMLFEMVTGVLPFQRSTAMETMQAVAFDDTPSAQQHRSDLPLELDHIIRRCLEKRPEDRYTDAGALVEALKSVRRNTESGILRAPWWRGISFDAWDRVRHWNPGQWAWVGASALTLGIVLYLVLADVSIGTVIFVALSALWLMRFVRNCPQRALEKFVRRVKKIPEVRIIAVQGSRIVVVVDRAPGQLYGRINSQLNTCNRLLFFGQPMQVLIRHDLSAEERLELLRGPGVQYAREEIPPLPQLQHG